MKRLIVLSLMLVASMATVAMAGDYHRQLTLVCSDCHIMHYSQSHGYSPGGSVFPVPAAGGPFTALLRDEDVNKTCMACHNGQTWAPDVFGDNILGATSVRLAGGLNAKSGHGVSNDAGYDEIDGHTLYETAMPPGGTGTAYVPATHGLECSNCHSVHGSVSYRNLQLRGIFAGDTVSYAVGTNDLLKDVYERSARAYLNDDVDYNEPNVAGSKYAQWCKNCHVDFHGAITDANMGDGVDWKRHPTSTVNISVSSTTSRWRVNTNHVKVMDSQGLWTSTSNTLTPSCFSCHKSHGNQNGFGLVFMAGTGTITENGDGGALRDMCRQCHGMGS